MSNDANAIAGTLKKLDFLIASKICVFPTFENNRLKYTAYIKVGEWMDCDMAYSVVRAMKDGKRTAAYIKETQQIWELEQTAGADIVYTESPNFQKWTTEFSMVDSDTESDYSEYEADLESIMAADILVPEPDFSKFSVAKEEMEVI